MVTAAIGDLTQSNESNVTGPMLARLERVRRSCGELCDLRHDAAPGAERRAAVNCTALFTEPALDAAREHARAPRKMPKSLLREYTMDGRVSFRHGANGRHVDESASSSQPRTWSRARLEQMIQLAREGTPFGHYESGTAAQVAHALHTANVSGGSVLVIGSLTPWVEAIALGSGAARVTTMEYGAIELDRPHPQLRVLTPSALNARALTRVSRAGDRREAAEFDVVVTYSSLEQCGAGSELRYGSSSCLSNAPF